MVFIKPGKKTLEWWAIRPILIAEYKAHGITACEYCGSTETLDIHHLDKRSSQKAQHTFKMTRLLCRICHNRADDARYRWFNDLLRRMR